MAKCGAKTKNGKSCKSYPMPNGRCRMHGGKSLAGIGSPNFKTGRYSRYLPERLIERYQESSNDSELLALRSEIALTDTRLADLLSRVDTGESGVLWKSAQSVFLDLIAANASSDREKGTTALNDLNRILNLGVDDYLAWDEIGKMLEQRRKLVESERKRLTDMEQMITAERAMVLLSAVVAIIKEHVTDRKALSAISTDIGQLISTRDVQRIKS